MAARRLAYPMRSGTQSGVERKPDSNTSADRVYWRCERNDSARLLYAAQEWGFTRTAFEKSEIESRQVKAWTDERAANPSKTTTSKPVAGRLLILAEMNAMASAGPNMAK